MKSGKRLFGMKEFLEQVDMEFAMVENCGMTNERIVYDSKDIHEDTGYYATIILKDR